MKPKDIFNLAVRFLGLIFLYHGLMALPAAVGVFLTVFSHKSFPVLVSAAVMAGWPLFLAYWLISGAPMLMRIAYPQDAEPEPSRPLPGQ